MNLVRVPLHTAEVEVAVALVEVVVEVAAVVEVALVVVVEAVEAVEVVEEDDAGRLIIQADKVKVT